MISFKFILISNKNNIRLSIYWAFANYCNYVCAMKYLYLYVKVDKIKIEKIMMPLFVLLILGGGGIGVHYTSKYKKNLYYEQYKVLIYILKTFFIIFFILDVLENTSSCRSYLYQNVDMDANLSPIDVKKFSWHHFKKRISNSKELHYLCIFSRKKMKMIAIMVIIVFFFH